MSTRNRVFQAALIVVFQAALLVAAALMPACTSQAQDASFAPAESGAAVAAPGGYGGVSVMSGGMTPGSIPPEVLKNMSPEDRKKFMEQRAKMMGHAGPGGPSKPGEPPKKPDDEKKKPEGEEKKPGDEKKDEGAPETVKRPTTPPEPADPEAIRKMKLGPDGKVRLNFTGHPWPDVLLWLARISGMSLDWQELPGDYLNLVTQREYKLDQVRDMINQHLLARGFTMIRQPEILWVVKIEKLNPSMVPRVEPEDLDKRDPHEFVKVSFELDWLVASEAVAELKPMLSSYAKLTPLTATNRMEAMDAVINLLELRKFLKDEQSPETQQGLVREFVLEHGRAADIRDQVLAILGMPPVSSGGGSRPSGAPGAQAMQQMQKKMQEQMKKMQQQMAQAAAKKPGGASAAQRQTQVSLIVNTRKNSIVAYAPPEKMVVIAQTIALLDVAPEGDDPAAAFIKRTQVYRLETIDPGPVVKTLEEVGNLDPRTRLEVDDRNKLIIAHAGLLDHATIQLLVSKLDGGGRRCSVIPLKKLRAESVVETVTFMMGGGEAKEESRGSERGRSYSPFGYPFGFSSPSRYGGSSSRRSSQSSSDSFHVKADVQNNALVLWANEFEKEKVEKLLDELRALPPKSGEGSRVHVYRLASIDPEPVVKTLSDMGNLEPRTTLTVDEKNRAIIVTASEADHEKIGKLLETLDGSTREFFVRHLRRLAAESVAGTIEFMLGAGESEKGYDRYRYYPYTNRMPPESKDGADNFRVDADLEYNRLLLWATDVEMQEVENLLVKLGEIPAEGGSPDTVRVLETGGGPELEALIERIRRTWTAPNPLIVTPPEKSEEETTEEKSREPATPPKTTTTQTIAEPVFKFAQLIREGADGEVPRQPPAGDKGAEVSPPPPPEADTSAEVPPDPTRSPPADASQDPAKDAPAAKAPPDPAEVDPRAPVPPDTGKSAGKPPAPVKISWGPDGRVIIASEDPKALDELEDLLSRYAPPRRDYKVYRLKYALATWVAYNLEDFFKEEEQGGRRRRGFDMFDYMFGYGYSSRNTGGQSRARLSQRRPVKFISDVDTNTILVQNADSSQLKTIEELIKLYDTPEPPDTQSVRVTEIVSLLYTKAQVVQTALKDVYRDLLSSNDKALQKDNQQKAERSYTYNYGDGGTATMLPRWKGMLSIGVDELSNSLIVSAPSYLFDDVKAKILELDEAARPVSTVRVLKVDGRLSAAGLQAKLAEILGQGAGGRRPSSGRPPSPRPPGGPPRPNAPRGPIRSGGGSYKVR